MAMGKTRPTRLRLTFNFRTGGRMSEQIRGFSSVLVEDVAMNVAEGMFEDIKAKIEKQLSVDVFREISWMAQQYRQYVIGISGNRQGLQGNLTSASAGAKGLEPATFNLSSGPWAHWPARGGRHRYLTWKQSHVHHKRWFDYSGLLATNMGRGKFWTSAYGPVKVEVKRIMTMSVADANRTANSQMTPQLRDEWMRRFDHGVRGSSGSSVQVQVANIRVAALERITPAMLPVLRLNNDGNINEVAPDGRATGLIGMFPKQIQWHLAGGQKFVPYRHTVEPFLGFVLTRSIPNAVARRIQEGLGGDIRQDRAGRDAKFAGGFVKNSRFDRG